VTYKRIWLPREGIIPNLDVGGAPPVVEGYSGGWYRPSQKQQNPAIDPGEPTNESGSIGDDHGWSNCTMSAGAMVLDFHTLGAINKWGGNLRHAPGQPDMSGGTDLWDVQKAWDYFGEYLDIRSGAGWDGVQNDRAIGCAIILTGEGEVPGAGKFAGGHAIGVLPETHSDGRILIADPLCSGPEWVSETDLMAWAENLDPSVNYARSAPHLPLQATTADDVMFNVGPITTHRDCVCKDGAVLYSDAGLSKRYSVCSGETTLGFVGSTNTAHIVVNAGYTNFIRREDVSSIVPFARDFE
jgi:hypothetical protein